MNELESLRPMVFKWVYRLCKNRDTAEDLTQEAFLRAVRAWDQKDPAREVMPWLARIASNCYFDHVRKARKRISALSFEDMGVDERTAFDYPDPAPLVPFADQVESDLEAAVNGLSPIQRTVILARADGERLTSIAARLGVSESSAKKTAYSARLKAQKLLAGAR